MRILGIDQGETRVGVAISDPRGSIAVPIGVYPRNGTGDPQGIASLARGESVELIVVGLPLSLDGSIGPQARRAQRFGLAVQTFSGLPVVFWDERFSTQRATRVMIESGASRKRRRHTADATAATIILQEYLDCQPKTPDCNA